MTLRQFPAMRRCLPVLWTLAVLAGLALLVGGLHAYHASLPFAEEWAENVIDSGRAPADERAALEQAFRDDHGWRDSEGAWSAWPDGRDSYYFLRLAREIANEGSPCPEQEGRCWETRILPPEGRPMFDARAPHPWSIALVHSARQALGDSPALLHSGRIHNALLLIACAGLIYLAVMRLSKELGLDTSGAALGGAMGAVALVLTPVVIQRTFTIDDDGWLALLLLITLLSAGSALGKSSTGRFAWVSAPIAGSAIGMLAAASGGWPFAMAMVGSAWLAALLHAVVVVDAHDRRRRALGATLVVPLFMAAGFLVSAYLLAPSVLEGLAAGTTDTLRGSTGDPSGDSFASVRELQPPDFQRLLELLGWPLMLLALAGLLLAGLALLALARTLLKLPWANWLDRFVSLPKAQATTSPAFPACLLLLLAWLLGALWVARTGERYLFLLAPVLAVLAGLCVAGLAGSLSRLGLRPVARIGLVVLLGLPLLGVMAVQARDLIANTRPAFTTAWATVLTELQRKTPAEAVLLGWWDIGHWASFWTERNVAVDGASLRYPRVHDVGRLLALDPEDRDTYRDRLMAAACGANTHPRSCEGPFVLLTSSNLLHQEGWMLSGFWASAQPQDSGEEPMDRLDRARQEAPGARVWSTGWHACEVGDNGRYDCPMGVRSANNWIIERFVGTPQAPDESRLIVRNRATGEQAAIPPNLLRIAGPQGLRDVSLGQTEGNPGVLLDSVNQRAFLGTPEMLRSLVARLVLLQGRYDEALAVPLAQSDTVAGERVTAWWLRLPGGSDRPDGRPQVE